MMQPIHHHVRRHSGTIWAVLLVLVVLFLVSLFVLRWRANDPDLNCQAACDAHGFRAGLCMGHLATCYGDALPLDQSPATCVKEDAHVACCCYHR